jgi:phosphoglycerate kinase
MLTLDKFNFAGKKALMRVDFNVPLDKQLEVTDDSRIQAAVKSINKILKDGGSVILMSHLGRPKDGPEDKYSLKHILNHLSNTLSRDVQFADDCIGEDAVEKANRLEAGQVLLLENLRFYKEEEDGDIDFAKKLARLGDVYVNDAFGTAHRAHASTSIVAQFFETRIGGYLMQAELDNAQKVLDNAEKPYTAIMGGAKISDKILIIEKMLDRVDNLIIGGGMSYTFTKAMGGNIGNSLVELDKLDLALELMEKAKANGVNLLLPSDSIIAEGFSNDTKTDVVKNQNIPDGWMGLDIGPDSQKTFAEVIKTSKTILWNGPMGVFE